MKRKLWRGSTGFSSSEDHVRSSAHKKLGRRKLPTELVPCDNPGRVITLPLTQTLGQFYRIFCAVEKGRTSPVRGEYRLPRVATCHQLTDKETVRDLKGQANARFDHAELLTPAISFL